MSTLTINTLALSIGASVLSGGILLGKNFDKIQVLCQEHNTLKNEHNLLKEKICEIHTKVCLIDQKLNTLINK